MTVVGATPASGGRACGSVAAALSGQWRHEHGASLVEYALLVALIALITIAAMQTLGSNVTDQIDNIANCIEDAAGAACATP